MDKKRCADCKLEIPSSALTTYFFTVRYADGTSERFQVCRACAVKRNAALK